MILRILALITVVSCCVLTLVLFMTSPDSVGPAGLLGIFMLGYLSLLGVVTFLFYYGEQALIVALKAFGGRPARRYLTLKRSYLFASVIAALPMMAIGLYSTGGVALHEILLIFMFGLIGILYVAKRS